MLKNIIDRLRETYQRLGTSLFGPSLPEARFILIPAGIVFSLLVLALLFSWFSPGNGFVEKTTSTKNLLMFTETPGKEYSPTNNVNEPETPTRTSSLRGTITSTASPTFFVRVDPSKTSTPVRTITRTRTQTLTRTITQTQTLSGTRTPTRTTTPTMERLVYSGDASTNLQGTPQPDGIIDIASMDIDGGKIRMIYAGTNLTGNLIAWDSSPDGLWFVTEAGPSTQRKLYLLQTDGLALKEIQNLPANNNSQAAWSPDGQWIVFRGGENGNGDLYAIRPGGDDLRQLTNGSEDEHMPDFSPDGQQLIYAANGDLWTMTVEGLYIPTLTPTLSSDAPLPIEIPTSLPTPRKLGYSNEDEEDSPRWSQDGAKIVFARKVDGNWKIYEAKLFTVTEMKSANLAGFDSIMPAWSSGGNFIFFVSNRDGNNEIYRLQINTGELKRLTNTSSNEARPFPIP